MEILPVVLEGKHVQLEPLTTDHAEALVSAAADGKLWNSTVTTVPSRETVTDYIGKALSDQSEGHALPFVIVRKPSGEIVGCTRFLHIDRDHRRVEIGYTWLATRAQRSAINTEAKLLLLTHAFEVWRCIRVELFTDLLNQQSRTAILRLGAKEEGILRNHMIMPNGRYRDSVCFSIIESEWPEVKAKLKSKLSPLP